MSCLKASFSSRIATVVLMALLAGGATARAAQEQFTLDLGRGGDFVRGSGDGLDRGTWYYYPGSDWWAQWFLNGPVDLGNKKVVEVDLTVRVLSPTSAVASSFEAAVNWTRQGWTDQTTIPMPDFEDPGQESKDIEWRQIVERTEIRDTFVVNTSIEIPDFCPAWISIDLRGENVSIEGRIRHECVASDGQTPSTGERDFGDAPEGVVAYPDEGVVGLFPTCVYVGPASWIEHSSQGRMYFGAKVDLERDGNDGTCPTFAPDRYDQDESSNDGDAGLISPRAYTIQGSPGSQSVVPLAFTGLLSLGNACNYATWGSSIDIQVCNKSADGQVAYVNVLMDWNHDGLWDGASPCGNDEAPEHVLANFPVPNGYQGPLSELSPSSFRIGPLAGYVWTRFTISEQPVMRGWNGDGIFLDGETEDYLLYVFEASQFCSWEESDDHAMHWAQLPDKSTTGIDVDLLGSNLADDFRAARSGPLTGIHFWGSYKDDAVPLGHEAGLAFEINIYSNKAADNVTPWSRPDKRLWTTQTGRGGYEVHEVTNGIPEGWYEPSTRVYEGSNHKRIFQYGVCLDPTDNPFVMTQGTIYWIEIKEISGLDAKYRFGWKTARHDKQFGGSAVWSGAYSDWIAMAYPQGHAFSGDAMDLAFVVTCDTQSQKAFDFGDAPDPPYPTLLVSDGARHTISPTVFLGRGVDGELDGQPNATATGDSHDDGVMFVTDLIPGAAATVQVTASVQGALNAWIDWNADGDWDDAGEQTFADKTLVAGLNTLTIDVPGRAVTGQTFARLRFSTSRGLRYTGLAPDGEVEDYQVRIQDAFLPARPVDHVKWSQPPIEQDPWVLVPVYCGWDEPAYVSKPWQSSTAAWKLPADNFRCIGDMPVTAVHWWGSYQDWTGDKAPAVKPQSWRIGFWSHARADNRYAFARPDKLLWVVNATADRVQEEPAGFDEFPRKPSDTAFSYLLDLTPAEYFRQDRHLSSTRDRVFWISVTAVYTGSPGPQYPWGWKTRPRPWSDGAVVAEFRRDDIRAGISLDPATAQPIANSLLCERLDTYDLAFELVTDPAWIKWEQPFTGLRDWPYYEDEQSVGAPTPRRIVADDLRCNTSLPITGFAWWGSYLGYGYLPCECQQMAAPRPPDYFLLSLWSDVPDLDVSDPRNFGHPGRKLWEYRADSFDEVLVGFDKDPLPTSSSVQGSEPVYRYTVRLPEDQWFRQDGQNNVLWLSVVAVYRDSKSMNYPWGWTNHPYVAWDLQGLAPLAHWKFDESKGIVAADSSGNGNHGTVVGNPVWRPSGGWFDGALDFDGRGDYVKVEKPKGFHFAPNSFSVSAWIYPRETRGRWHAILEYDRDSLNGNRFGLWLDTEGRFHFRVGQNTWQSPSALTPNQWYHVAATFEGDTRAMKLYVDGVHQATATNQKGFVTPTQATLIIGARGSADDEYFVGLIDDVRVFRAALTAEEVVTLSGFGRNEGAVVTDTTTGGTENWKQLLDQTGLIEDMSFMLLTQPSMARSTDAEVVFDAK